MKIDQEVLSIFLDGVLVGSGSILSFMAFIEGRALLGILGLISVALATFCGLFEVSIDE